MKQKLIKCLHCSKKDDPSNMFPYSKAWLCQDCKEKHFQKVKLMKIEKYPDEHIEVINEIMKNINAESIDIEI